MESCCRKSQVLYEPEWRAAAGRVMSSMSQNGELLQEESGGWMLPGLQPTMGTWLLYSVVFSLLTAVHAAPLLPDPKSTMWPPGMTTAAKMLLPGKIVGESEGSLLQKNKIKNQETIMCLPCIISLLPKH
ncbi:unnamed protein product [Ranitomeya imitator]|uniref:Uncharacterized protein n=1 Tax=Ranitomeya imitator TaxID=111125 RepID=A0ABN9M8S2_9NEOB|nr:unnamed protein product [Ranitomeya imitator]